MKEATQQLLELQKAIASRKIKTLPTNTMQGKGSKLMKPYTYITNKKATSPQLQQQATEVLNSNK